METIMTTVVNSAGGDEAELQLQLLQQALKEKEEKEMKRQLRVMKETVGEAKWDVDRIFKGNEEDGRDITDVVMAVITAHDVRRPDARRRYKAALAHCINAKPTKVEGRRNRGIPKEKRTLEVLSTASTTEYDYKILQASRFFFMRVRTLNDMLIEVDQLLQGKKPALLAPVLLPSESGALSDHSSTKSGGKRGRGKAARRSKAAARLQEMPGLVRDPRPMEVVEKGPRDNDGDVQRERTKWHGAVLDPTAPKEERFKAFIEQLFYHVDDEDELECLDLVAKCMADPSVYGDERIDVYQRGKILEYFKLALPHILVSPFYAEAILFSQFVKTTVITINKDIGITGKDDSDDDNHPMLKRYDEIMEKRRAEAEAKKKPEEEKAGEKENETSQGRKKRGAKRKLKVESTDESSDEREAPGLAQFIGQDGSDADVVSMGDTYDHEEVVDNESSVGDYFTPPPYAARTTMTSLLNVDGDRTPLADQRSVGLRTKEESEMKKVKEEEQSDADDEQDEEDLEFQRRMREMSMQAVKEEPMDEEEQMGGEHPVETRDGQLRRAVSSRMNEDEEGEELMGGEHPVETRDGQLRRPVSSRKDEDEEEEPLDGEHPVETPESLQRRDFNRAMNDYHYPMGGVHPVETRDAVRVGSDDGEKEEEQMEDGDDEEDEAETAPIRRSRGRPLLDRRSLLSTSNEKTEEKVEMRRHSQSITPQLPKPDKKEERSEKKGHSQSITPQQPKTDKKKREERADYGDEEERQMEEEATPNRRPRGRPPQSITPKQPNSGKKMGKEEKSEQIGHSMAKRSQSITPKQLKMEDDKKMENEDKVETRRHSMTSRSQSITPKQLKIDKEKEKKGHSMISRSKSITPKSYQKKMEQEEEAERGAQKGRPQSTPNEKQPETRRSPRVSQEYAPKKHKK